MKKSIFIALISLATFSLSAQYVPTPDDLDQFLKTKTLVVQDRNPLNTIDSEIEEVMKSEWDITEYEIIPWDQFEEKRKDPNNSFLFLTTVTFEKDKLQVKYKFLNLSLGGEHFQLNQMPDLVSVPVAYVNAEDETYSYKLGILVRFIQNHIRLIHKNPDVISANVFKHYNDNTGDVQQKTLWLIEDEMASDVNSAARIRKVYPHKIKMVSRDDIREAVINKDEDVVFLHKVGPEGTRMKARCYKILIGASDAKFYYFDYHMINDKNPDGLLGKDLKKIGK